MVLPLLLVVDDAPEIGFIVRRLGKHAGYEAAACGDVPAAWAYLRTARRPDLVLLDLNLPGAPGLELCRRLRAAPDLAGLPVALFAHWDRSEDIAAGLAAGADAVVSKDLLTQPDAWAARIRQLLAREPGRTATTLQSCSPERVVQALNQALRQAAVRQAGPQVLRVLARRAGVACRLAGGPDDWLRPDGLGLSPAAVARLGAPDAAVAFAVALAAQIETVLGTAPGILSGRPPV